MRLLIFVTVLHATACATAVDPTDGTSSTTSSIVLGDDDLVPVAEDGANIPARLRPSLDAIGKTSPIGCTVTHLGDGLAITAGHCFGPERDRERGVACTTSSGRPVTIAWGLRGDRDAYLVSRCTEIVAIEFHQRETDFAVIRVSPVPPVAAVFLAERPVPGRALTILSHPRGRALEWSQTCERGELLSPTVFTHRCDTEPGSSGAPIFDDAAAYVIGIHNGGDPDNQYNYGTFLADVALGAAADDRGAVEPAPPADDIPLVVGEQFAYSLHKGEQLTAGPWTVAAGATLTVTTHGWGDVDLVVGTCDSHGPSAEETCTVVGPGTFEATITGYAAASGFDIDVE